MEMNEHVNLEIIAYTLLGAVSRTKLETVQHKAIKWYLGVADSDSDSDSDKLICRNLEYVADRCW